MPRKGRTEDVHQMSLEDLGVGIYRRSEQAPAPAPAADPDQELPWLGWLLVERHHPFTGEQVASWVQCVEAGTEAEARQQLAAKEHPRAVRRVVCERGKHPGEVIDGPQSENAAAG